MNVRFAEARDVNEVLGLLDELIKEVNLKRGQRAPKGIEGQEARREIFSKLLEREDVKIFVAEDNGHLVGVCDLFILPIMRRGNYHGHIEDLVISKNVRGKGIGSMLLNAVKDYCKQQNINVIKLTSGLELVSAHKFYEKNGGKFEEKMFRFDL